MNRPPTAEEAFASGAEAMKAKITATLMMSGNTQDAVKVLSMAIPKFSMPERQYLSGGSKETPHV